MELWFFLLIPSVLAAPKFDQTSVMQDILIPADAAIKSTIYRLKAYDTSFDYPLLFNLREISNVVDLDILNCTRFNSLCQANVVLKSKLEPGRVYDFSVSLTNGKGEVEVMQCSFRATNATTPIEKIFPGAPALLKVAESARRNTDVATLVARGNLGGEKKVLLELFGPPQFALRQRIINGRDVEGTIVLLSQLDYEKSPSHHLMVYANDPWTDTKTDTRNIATWPLFVSVLDEQDTPPVFTRAPPTTHLDPSTQPGDIILAVKAEDGDKGDPRDIRYVLVPDEGNPAIGDFFEVTEATGELRLKKPIEELFAVTSSKSPLLLTIRAEELRRNSNEPPSQSTSVQIALLPPSLPKSAPIFASNEYTATLDENSPRGTLLTLRNPEVTVSGGEIYTLELLNNNSTFEITPRIIKGTSTFSIKVKNSTLLDYETRRQVEFDILAKKFDGDENASTKSHVIVYLNDVNDNTPTFRKDNWTVDLPEDAGYGTEVLKVAAFNKENLDANDVMYTQLSGKYSDAFRLDERSGLITLIKPDDIHSEKDNVIQLTVQAKGRGSENTATAVITLNIVDVNDHKPTFDKNPYEFILDESRTQFTIPAFIKAIDQDSTSPNNDVKYELVERIDNLTLNPLSGELVIRNRWTKTEIEVIHARAYDGGVPRLSDETEIRLYPPESKFRKMLFVVPGQYPNREDIARTLSAIVGDRVTIDEVRPYTDSDGIASDINKMDRSIVVATVPNSSGAVVDVQKIQKILDQRTVEKETIIQRAEGPNLWWLFWLLLILALIAAIAAILCCICEGCPWYIAPKKRTKVQSADVRHLVINGAGQGKESKSVQVAEWFGRKEAWTPEAVQIDLDTESLRRHEVERGSDRAEIRRMHRQQQHTTQEVPRDHLYIREGNADILRLITRGNEQQRPITLVQEQPYIIDSGKDILLRRFIDQQQSEIHRSNVNIPQAMNKLQAENEILEQSLRTQNALLRQILAEREREIRLETQSLPAGTQTDQDAGTQTEPLFMRPPKRKTRSDNEISDISDEDDEKYRRRYRRNGRRMPMKRKINTPIQEESENNLESEKKQQSSAAENRRLSFGHTKTSLLRKKAAEENSKGKSKSALRREVLREISASLLQSEGGSDSEPYRRDSLFSEDSLEEEVISRRNYYKRQSESSRSDSRQKPIKYLSHSDLHSASTEKPSKKINKSQSQLDLTKKPKPAKRGSSRYMEWYKKDKKKDDAVGSATSRTSTKVTKKIISSDLKSSGVTKTQATNVTNGPDHPLIQHSEHRFEILHPRRQEDDADSGIALTRPAMALKKSVFTIAYDDMQTRHIRQDSATPPM